MSDSLSAADNVKTHEIGGGLTKKQAKKIRMETMTKEEIGYLRRKALLDRVWPVFRFLIIFGSRNRD